MHEQGFLDKDPLPAFARMCKTLVFTLNTGIEHTMVLHFSYKDVGIAIWEFFSQAFG